MHKHLLFFGKIQKALAYILSNSYAVIIVLVVEGGVE